MGKKKGDNDLADRQSREQPLQAVLLAYDWMGGFAANPSDTWQFRPLDLDRPKVLCPLVNQTMIDYSIKYLAGQGAKEIYVVCVTETVEEYVKSSLSLTKSDAAIVVVRDPSVSNEGDALRELDKRSVIESDPFILLRGDTIANCDLSEAIKQHQTRHKVDSSAIYTMVLKPSPNVQSLSHDLLVGIDPNQGNRILLFNVSNESKSVAFPCSFFANHCSSLVTRNDLADVGLDLCSPDVLARFSDEFDYRSIRSQFITNSVAEEEEGLQNKIFAHVTEQYAAKCTDFRTYDQIARDLMRRKVHPIVPDTLRSYRVQRHFLYEETSGKTRIGRSSKIDGPGMIGRNCFVGEDCVIQSSVLSEYCHIADKSTIVNSHLLEGVQIESGATISNSILGAGVVVLSGANVGRGCVIGAGCIIGANVTLPEYTRLTCAIEKLNDDLDDDWDDDEEDSDNDIDTAEADPSDSPAVTDTDLVGPDGLGRQWKPQADDLDDDEFEQEAMLPATTILQSQCPGFDATIVNSSRLAFYDESNDDGLSDMDDETESLLDGDDLGVTFGATLAAAPATIIGRQDGVDVVQDLKTICSEFDASSGHMEHLAIELNSYKFSQNATYADCTMGATLAIMDQMAFSSGDAKLVGDFKALLQIWKPLLVKLSIGVAEELGVVNALQRMAISPDTSAEIREKLTTGMSFRLLLQTLHDEEVVSEDAILAWAGENRADSAPGHSLVNMQPIQEFLEWLEDDSDDDSSSGEEGESEEED